MNDIRRTILWVIFCVSLVLLWDKWQIHNGKEPTFFPSPVSATAEGTARSPAKPGDASVPQAATSTAGAGDVPGGVPGETPTAPAVPRQDVVVANDVLRLTFDSEGGSLKRAELLKYAETGDPSKAVTLLDESMHRVYMAQTGLIGGSFPTH